MQGILGLSMNARDGAEILKLKSEEALKFFYTYQEEGLQYDLDLIQAQLAYWLPDLDVKYKIESMYDGVGMQITINVLTPNYYSYDGSTKVYDAIYDIADELVFNNWMVHFHYKGE